MIKKNIPPAVVATGAISMWLTVMVSDWGCVYTPPLAVPPESFFFSSRRRHTRSLCDWSSDVCLPILGGNSGIDHDGVAIPQELVRERVGVTMAGLFGRPNGTVLEEQLVLALADEGPAGVGQAQIFARFGRTTWRAQA